MFLSHYWLYLTWISVGFALQYANNMSGRPRTFSRKNEQAIRPVCYTIEVGRCLVGGRGDHPFRGRSGFAAPRRASWRRSRREGWFCRLRGTTGWRRTGPVSRWRSCGWTGMARRTGLPVQSGLRWSEGDTPKGSLRLRCGRRRWHPARRKQEGEATSVAASHREGATCRDRPGDHGPGFRGGGSAGKKARCLGWFGRLDARCRGPAEALATAACYTNRH
jgi:hypothetical protein